MFRMSMKTIYQCWDCGKAHDTEEAALKCHNSSIQVIKKGYQRWYKRKGLLGN